jgi:hypothetical protein
MGQVAYIPAGQSVQLNFSYIPSLVGNNTLTLKTSRNGGTTIPGSGTVNISTLVIDNDGSNNTGLIEKNDGRSGNVKLAGRTLYKDGLWNTLCLPFNVTLSGSELAGAEARTLNSASLSNGVLTLNFGEPVTELTAGTPYIIKWYDSADPASRDITAPVFTNVTISKNYNDFVSSDGMVHFLGRYSARTYTKEEENTLLLGGDNTLYYPQPNLTDPENPQYPSIGACRAFFKITNSAPVRAFNFNFGDGSEETGIEEILNRQSSNSESLDVWYSLDGIRLTGMPTLRGIYINNGKKVIIK